MGPREGRKDSRDACAQRKGHRGHSRKAAICKPRREAPGELKPADILILATKIFILSQPRREGLNREMRDEMKEPVVKVRGERNTEESTGSSGGHQRGRLHIAAWHQMQMCCSSASFVLHQLCPRSKPSPSLPGSCDRSASLEDKAARCSLECNTQPLLRSQNSCCICLSPFRQRSYKSTE